LYQYITTYFEYTTQCLSEVKRRKEDVPRKREDLLAEAEAEVGSAEPAGEPAKEVRNTVASRTAEECETSCVSSKLAERESIILLLCHASICSMNNGWIVLFFYMAWISSQGKASYFSSATATDI